MTPSEIAEHLKEICPELNDLDVEQVLAQQESAFLYLENSKKNMDVISEYGQNSRRHVSLDHEDESPFASSLESQLAVDEALARALELGDDLNNLYIFEHGGSRVGDMEPSFGENPGMVLPSLTPLHKQDGSRNIRQDDINSDRITYENLQEPGESVGSESKGLPADLISRLPAFKYKSGLSKEKNKEKEECVICCAEYKNGVELTTLPCAHHYHSDCITQWLQMNKHCPVCQREVPDE